MIDLTLDQREISVRDIALTIATVMKINGLSIKDIDLEWQVKLLLLDPSYQNIPIGGDGTGWHDASLTMRYDLPYPLIRLFIS